MASCLQTVSMVTAMLLPTHIGPTKSDRKNGIFWLRTGRPGFFSRRGGNFLLMTRFRPAQGSTKQLESLSNIRLNENTVQMTATVIFLSSSGGHPVPFGFVLDN